MIVVGLVGLWAWGNQAPQAQTRVLFAEPQRPVEVVLAAEDPDGDPLEYELLDTPGVGTLLGMPPRLTYCPSPGFSGSVRISFRVRDPHGSFDVGWVEIRISAAVQPIRLVSQAPANPTLLNFMGFLSSWGIKTWYIADIEPRSLTCGVIPFLFAGRGEEARVFLVGPTDAPTLQDFGKVHNSVLWVNLQQASPGLYFFLVLSGEKAFTYPVRLVQPAPVLKLAYSG